MVNSRLLVFAIQQINYWITWQAWVYFLPWGVSNNLLSENGKNIFDPLPSPFSAMATKLPISPRVSCLVLVPPPTPHLPSNPALHHLKWLCLPISRGNPFPLLQTQADRKQGIRKRREGEHWERIETWTVQSAPRVRWEDVSLRDAVVWFSSSPPVGQDEAEREEHG